MDIVGPAQDILRRAIGQDTSVTTGLDVDVLDEVRFQKQCFLSYNLLEIIEKTDPIVRRLPAGRAGQEQIRAEGILPNNEVAGLQNLSYGTLPDSIFQVGGSEINPIPTSPNNYTVIRGGMPADITSLIVGHPEITKILDQKPYLLSFFVPYIRIYKVVSEYDAIATNLGRSGLVTQPSYDFDAPSAPVEPEAQLLTIDNVLGPGPWSSDSLLEEAATILGHEPSGVTGGGTIEVEFLFDHKTNKEDIEAMMESRRGRAGGVGLKSFSWEFLGVNPAEVENNIKTNLKFYFNDINEFDRERTALGIPGLDLSYRFSDLIIAEPLRRASANSAAISEARDAYNPDHFRLKVVVGWSLKPKNESISETFSDEDYDKLVALSEESRKVLYLTLLRHDLNFNQDGSVELSADYQAYAESIFAHPGSDILRVRPRPGGSTTSTQRRYDEISSAIRSISDIRSNCGSPGDVNPEENLTNISEEAAQIRDLVEQDLRLERSRDRSFAYQQIMERLVDSSRVFTIRAPTGVLGLGSRSNIRQAATQELDEEGNVVASGDVGLLAGLIPRDPQEEEESNVETGGDDSAEAQPRESTGRIRRRATATRDLNDIRRLIARRRFTNSQSQGFQVEFYGQPSDLTYDLTANASLPNAMLQQSLNADFSSPEKYQEFLDTQIRGLQERMQWSRRPSYDYQTITFDFMFFGDILDVVLENCVSWMDRSNVALFLGTFPYTDPRMVSDGHPIEEATVPVSLAYIPVSVELFSMWFLEEIVEPQLNRMSIRQFIRSVFDKLIINSFGSDCVWDATGLSSLTQERISVVPEFYEILKSSLRNAGMDSNTLRRIRAINPDTLSPQVGEVHQQLNYAAGMSRPFYESERLSQRELDEYATNYLHSYQGNTIEYDVVRQSTEPLLAYEGQTSYDDYVHVLLYQDQSRDHMVGDLLSDINYGEAGFVYTDQVRQDAARGIYHLNLGSDRGLVKKIEFNRIDQQYVLEARIEAAGELGSFDQLRERYNATVIMYGNSFFYPGQHVYLNPSMLGANVVPDIESMTTKLGLGGYFVVTKVENIIESGLYETILECSWVYSGFQVDGATRECPNRSGEVQSITDALSEFDDIRQRLEAQTAAESEGSDESATVEEYTATARDRGRERLSRR